MQGYKATKPQVVKESGSIRIRAGREKSPLEASKWKFTLNLNFKIEYFKMLLNLKDISAM